MMEHRNKSLEKQETEEECVGDDEEEPEVVIRTAIHYLREFVTAKGHILSHVTSLPNTQLAAYLKEFYTSVKNRDDVPESISLKYIRAGLQRYFAKKSNIDILRDKSFDHANAVFDITIRQTPRRCHRLLIDSDDLKHIYLGPAMNTDQPDTLQNKVFFDINLYICNRGKDFLRVMSKIDFDVSTDTDGRKYVWLKYHPKFSFKELVGGLSDNEPVMQGSQVGEKMYERPGDHRCPVASFQKYVSHLHPMTEMFWQRPKRSFVASDLVWYDNTPLGNSTLSKIMTRMCSMAGLTENYTNHAIKSTYIPLIEKMCKDALKRSTLLDLSLRRINSPLTRSKGSEDACMTDVSSVCSDVKEEEENPNSGLRQAKMKVLETVHGLEVKDIRTFVDWLKTFRVELDGGGLVVMCSPVDQSRQTSMDSRQGSFDDPRSRQNSMDDFNRSIDSPSRNDNRLPNGNQLLGSSSPIQPKRGVSPSPLIKPTISLTKADSIEKSDKEFSVSVRQFDFDTSSGTHCASMENLKMTVPSQDTVLMTGIPESVQVLVHNRDGSPMISEPVQSRLFYSSNDMDIAVVSALLGERNSLKNNIPNTGAEKSDYYSKLLDKFKPMKKRSLSDLVAGTKIDGDDDPAKKKFASTEGLEPIHASMATQSQPVSKPVTINTQLLPVMVSQPSQLLPRHLLPSKAINAQPVPLMISHHQLMANTQPMPLMTTEPVSVHAHNMLSKVPAFQQPFIQNKSMYKREDNPAYFPVRPGLMKMKMDPKPK